MARRRIFGRVNTQFVRGETTKKGQFQKIKWIKIIKKKNTTLLVGRFNGLHARTFEPNSWFRCDTSTLSYDSSIYAWLTVCLA